MQSTAPSIDVDRLKRQLRFKPCKNKTDLHRWIKLFLGLDMPDCKVDPTSTSTPMDLIWEVYDIAMKGGAEDMSRIMSYAARDSFKCVVKGTRLLSRSRGLVPIETVIVGEQIWSGKAWRPVTNTIHDGLKEGRRLLLQNGLSLTGSPVHRIWSWSPGGRPGWKALRDLTSQDLVRVDITPALRSEDESLFNIGYLCGLLVGDGCLTMLDQHRITLTTADPAVLEAWKRACLKYVGREPKQSKSRHYDWTINSKALADVLRSWGFSACYSWEKSVPEICFSSPSHMAGFISGVLDTDGSVSSKNAVEFQMTAFELLRQIQVMVTAMGVPAQLRRGKKLYPQHGQKHIVHRLWVNQNSIPMLLAAGVRQRAQKARLIQTALTTDAHDAIPQEQLSPLLGKLRRRGGKWFRKGGGRKPSTNYRTITRPKVLDLVNWGLFHTQISEHEADFWREVVSTPWSPVKEVTETEADFYDLTVDEDHSYWSDGIISHNTLGAAILEVLMVLHARRNVVHLAALKEQSKKAQQYVKSFFRKPYLREFVEGDNVESIRVLRYEHKRRPEENLTQKEWGHLTEAQKAEYEEIDRTIEVVVCTITSCNGKHSAYMCVDEVDILPNEAAYEEAKMIPTGQFDVEPITLLTSTRKSSIGLVQREIDDAQKSGLHIRHWNIIDVTRACPPERHLPMEPMIPIYRNDDTLEAISQKAYEELVDAQKERFVKDEGYAGCIQNCRLFSVCRGRLATQQRSQSPLLKKVSTTQGIFRSLASVDTIKAQLMCWKPSSEGLVYPRFDPDLHLVTAGQMMQLITGEEMAIADGQWQAERRNVTRADLIAMFRERGCRFVSGMDFGYTHNFAVVTAAIDGHRAFIFDVIEVAQLELPQRIAMCKEKLLPWNPDIFPDMAYPADIKTFKRNGFKMIPWKKNQGSVKAGIEVVRMKLRPPMGDPEMFFLRGDPGVESLCQKLTRYHWKKDAAGRWTDIPNDVDDDSCDALRYGTMNTFMPRGRIISSNRDEPTPPATGVMQIGQVRSLDDQQKMWSQQIMQHVMGGDGLPPQQTAAEEAPTGGVRRKGRLFWAI